MPPSAVMLLIVCIACHDPTAPTDPEASALNLSVFTVGNAPIGPYVKVCWPGGQPGDTAYFHVTADDGVLMAPPDSQLLPGPDEVSFGLPHVEGYSKVCAFPWRYDQSMGDDTATVTVTQTGTTSLQTDSLLLIHLFEAVIPSYGPIWVLQLDPTHPPDTVATFQASNVRYGEVHYHNVDDGSPQITPPDTLGLPLNPTAIVAHPSDSSRVLYREYYAVSFDDTTSATGIAAFLDTFDGTIVGGDPGSGPVPDLYIIRIGDPGPAYSDVEAIMDQMAATPGVRWAFAATFKGGSVPDGRYPTDGSGSARADWLDSLSSSSSLWGPRSIRAPLAWGCENGRYSSDLVRIGILDLTFDTPPQDLQEADPDGITIVPPLAPRLAPSDRLQQIPAMRSHGTSVAGLVTARGNNGVGTVGMLWRSQLYLFPMGVNTTEATFQVQWLDHIVDSALAHDVRILNLSMQVGELRETDYLESIFKKFLDASNGLIVAAAGNAPVRITIDSLAAIEPGVAAFSPVNIASRIALARLMTSGYEDQILFVAASQFGNTMWSSSAFFGGSSLSSGVATVVGPGRDILVLMNESVAGVTHAIDDGATSYAAPYVSGLAGQLWTMMPTLTPGEVRRYIVEGATAATHTGADGIPVLPQPVATTGMGAAYEIDAYSSLKMLSSERNDAPICGHKVSFNSSSDSLILHKNTPVQLTVDALDAIGHNGYHGLSVAQGGRLISAWLSADPDPPVALIDQLGNPVGPLLNDVGHRFYLEDGYADVTRFFFDLIPPCPPIYTSGGEGYRVTIVPEVGESSTSNVVVASEDACASDIRGELAISPSGDWAALQSFERWDDNGAEVWDLIPLSNPSARQRIFLESYLNAVTYRGPAVWSDDAMNLLVVQNYDDTVVGPPRTRQALLQRVAFTPGGSPSIGAPVTLADWVFEDAWVADEALLLSTEIQPPPIGTCRVSLRAWPDITAAPASSVLGGSECAYVGIRQSNLVAAGSLTGRE